MSLNPIFNPAPVSSTSGSRAYPQTDDGDNPSNDVAPDDDSQPQQSTGGASSSGFAVPLSKPASWSRPAGTARLSPPPPAPAPASNDQDAATSSATSSVSSFGLMKPKSFLPQRAPAAQAPAPAAATLAPDDAFNYTLYEQDPVLAKAFAPQIAATRDRQAQAAADAQDAARRRADDENAQFAARAQASGMRTFRDGRGKLQPLLDADTGKPLYHPHTGDVQYNPDGTPFQETRDQYGNVTTSNPDADAPIGPSDDPHDPHLYRQTKYQPWQAIGHVDDLAGDAKQPKDVQAAAQDWRGKRDKLIFDAGHQAAQTQAADAKVAHMGAQTQFRQVSQAIDDLSPSYGADGTPNEAAKDQALAGQKQSTGWFSSADTDAATAAKARNAERAKKLGPLQQQQSDLQAQLGTAQAPGPLPLAEKAATADTVIMGHLREARKYANSAEQRRQIIQAEGGNEDTDPILAAILAKQKEFDVKTQDAHAQRQQVVQQASDAGHDLGPWYKPVALTPAPGGQPDGSGAAPATPTPTAAAAAAGQPQASAPTATPPAPVATPSDPAPQTAAPSAPAVTPAKPSPWDFDSESFENIANAGREAVGGAAGGTLAIAEGFQRTMAGQEAATPQSVNAYLDKQIADRQAAVAKLATSTAPDSDQAKSALNVEIKRLQAKRANPRLLQAGDAPGLSSRFLLSAEGQKLRDARVAAADETANTLADAKKEADTYFGQDPARKNTALATVANAAGGVVPLLAASAVPGGAVVGAGVAGLQAKASAYDEALADAKKSGMVDANGEATPEAKAQAQQYSDAAAIRTVPEMAAFLGTGKVAAGVVSKLLSPTTPAALRFLVSAATSTAANAATGTATQVAEQVAAGKPVTPTYDLRRLTQDALFGGLHGITETANAAREHTAVAQQIAQDPATLASVQSRLDPVSADKASAHLAIPHAPGMDAQTQSFADQSVAESFAARNPGATRIDPGVVEKARGYAPPDANATNPAALSALDQEIGQARQAAGDETQTTADQDQARQRLASAYAQKDAIVKRNDARLAAVQQIYSLPDWQPPLDPKTGQPDGAPDPARNRETVGTLLKLTQGFTPEDLTSSEQARLDTPKGVPPLVRKAQGQTILTDAGREVLAKAAPAATPFIVGDEAQQLRDLLRQPAPATSERPPRSASTTDAVNTPSRDTTPDPEPTPEAHPEAATPRQDRAPMFAPGDTPQAKADAFSEGYGTAVKFEPGEAVPREMEGATPSVTLPNGTRVFYDAQAHVPEDFGAEAKPDKPADIPLAENRREDGMSTLSGEDKPTSSQPEQAAAPKEPPKPITRLGINAHKAIAHIENMRHEARTAGTDLSPGQEAALANARKVLAAEMEKQAATAHVTEPNTEAGKRARFTIQALHKYREDGNPLNRGQHDTLRAAHEAYHADLDAQRDASYAGQQSRTVRRSTDDLAEGDRIKLGNLLHTVSGPADEGHVQVTSPNGRVNRIARDLALRQRVERAATPGQEPSAEAQAEPDVPRHDVDLEEQAHQEREYRQQLQDEAREQIRDSGGVELIDAVRKAGGIPTTDPALHGEIENVRQSAQSAHAAGYTGVFNLFNKSAKLDTLMARLNDQGFDFQTPAEMLDAIQRRVATKQSQYGHAALARAQYRRQAQPPRTPEELLPTAQKYRDFLSRVSPKLAGKLEVIRQEQLDSLWKGQDRPPGDIQAAHLAGTIYLVHEALEANPEHVNVVNLLHEAAHSFERVLPEGQRKTLRLQMQAEMKTGKSPLHNADGSPRAEVDQRAFDSTNPEQFSEWLAERLGWENAQWAQGRAAANNPIARFAQSFRVAVSRVFGAFRPGDDVHKRFRDWLASGVNEGENIAHDGAPARAAVRDWFARFGRGQVPENRGQVPAQEVSSGREDVAPQAAGLDPVTGTRSWLSEPGKSDGGAGAGAMDALPPPDGRNPGAAGLEGSARSDAGERTGAAAGGGSEQQQRVDQAARARGLAVKKYVGDVAAAAVDVGSLGRPGEGVSAPDVASRASELLRLTPDRARRAGFGPEAVAALERIRAQIPLLPRERLVQSIDTEQVRNWHSSDESYSASEGGQTHIEHYLKTRTLDALFNTRGVPLRDHLSGIAARQKASGQKLRLELIGVGNEGAAFRDRESGLIYKFHPGTEDASAYGITKIEPRPDGTTYVGVEKVPLTEAIRRYERQNLVSAAIPTEVAGITPEGILVTKQHEMATHPETTFPEIERLLENAGGVRIKEPGGSQKRQTWAVPDGEGNWMVAADLKPANVLREKATGEPKITDGILGPITPEVLRDNPQLAEHAATNPEAQFVRRKVRDAGTGDLFERDREPGSEDKAAGWPRLRSGERQGDLLSNQTEDLRLSGEEGTDHDARQQAARESDAARAGQDQQQGSLFATKPEAEDAGEPISNSDTYRAAAEHLEANWPLLQRMGMKSKLITETKAGSGVEMGEDGVLRVNIPKLARSLEAVRDVQARKGIAGTPEDWFAAVLYHEGVHAADFAIAREKGQTARQRYDALPEEAMPKGWQEAGRKATGAEQWDGLADWQKKAEFSRMILEGRWHGRITEQVYRVLKQTADYLRRVAGFEGTDPRFQQHIAEIEARIETARNTPEESESNEAAAWPKEAPQFARRATIKETVQAVRDGVASRESKDKISAGFDAADTYGNMIGHQAGNTIRLDLPDAKDRESMPFVVEAAGNKAALQADLAKVQASTDPKLAAKFAPIIRHAIANFTRLDGLKGNYDQIATKQATIERRNGLQPKDVQDRVTRYLDLPENQRHLEPLLLGKGTRYLARGQEFDKLSDAIQAGYSPRSTDLADLLEHRVSSGQRMVQSRRLYAQLKGVKAPGDEAGRSIIGDMETHTLANGQVETRPPVGYKTVDAAGVQLPVHAGFEGLFRALYGQSAYRKTTPGRLLMKAFAAHKTFTLALDTFHAVRVASKELFYGYQIGYRKGLSLLEHNDADLSRMVASGDVSQQVADWAKEHRPAAQELIRAGLNVGQVADNFLQQAKLHIPGTAKINEWIFGKLSRGGMLQAAITNYHRNLSRFPELGQEGAARRTAKEMNEVFGNLQNQGLLKNKSFQDTARLVLLAPQWTESQLRAEVRGYGQLARVPLDAIKGKLRIGAVAQGQVSTILGMLAAGQIANYLATGHSTLQNDDDHKTDVFIPSISGGRGFYWSPWEMAAELTHDALHYNEHDKAADIPLHIATNKLNGLFRAGAEAASGYDLHGGIGNHFPDTGSRMRAAAADAVPSPLPLGSLIEKDPRNIAGSGPVHDLRSAADKVLAPLGYRVNRQPDSAEKQLLQAAGVKTVPAPSATTQMNAIAAHYRAPHLQTGAPPVYGELKRAIDAGDDEGAKDELRALHTTGYDLADIGKHVYGVKADGHADKALFTGSEEGDRVMLGALTSEQRKLYGEAQKEHHTNAQKFQQLANRMRGEFRAAQNTTNPQGLAVMALRHGNLGLVSTLIQQGKISPEELPALKRQAKQKPQPIYTHPTSFSAPSSMPPARPLWTPPPISSMWEGKGRAT